MKRRFIIVRKKNPAYRRFRRITTKPTTSDNSPISPFVPCSLVTTAARVPIKRKPSRVFARFTFATGTIVEWFFCSSSPPPKKWSGAGISAGCRRSRTNAIARGADGTRVHKSSTGRWPRWRWRRVAHCSIPARRPVSLLRKRIELVVRSVEPTVV